MHPYVRACRLYASDAAKKRGKARWLDNAVAGTSKIQRFFVTTTAAEDETPKAIQEIEVAAVDVAPPLPAPEAESAAETAAAESAPGPVVQEL